MVQWAVHCKIKPGVSRRNTVWIKL